MKRFKWHLFFILLSSSGLLSCIKQEDYPNEPTIGFVQFVTAYDTSAFAVKGILSVSFTDGNGDIGLRPGDTLFPYDRGGQYYYNYVLTFFNKVNGVYTQIDLDPPFSARIPVLNPDYPGKPIKGVITDTINLQLVPHPGYDTIRFEAFIYDRALNKSNVITTPEIILKRPY
jgi:hypothetical protein